jgi:hypothetical protein
MDVKRDAMAVSCPGEAGGDVIADVARAWRQLCLKRKRLETEGWRVGTAAEFLEVTPEESA